MHRSTTYWDRFGVQCATAMEDVCVFSTFRELGQEEVRNKSWWSAAHDRNRFCFFC